MQLSEKSKWNGFEKHSYTYNDREAIVVFPEKGSHKKWVWRTEFFDAFPYADIEMVKAWIYSGLLQNKRLVRSPLRGGADGGASI